MVLQRRIYVGNLSNDPEGCLKQLGVRFATVGRCIGEFETHGSFAYINMEFEADSELAKFKNSFNHIKFRGNELRVEEAKLCWKWEEQKRKDDKDEPKKRKQIVQRHWEYYKKIENINRNRYDRIQVIPGRIRKNTRGEHQVRKMTFRVNVNGSLKVYKCSKQKLWGYERNKEIRDLVYRFANGKWLDGWDHIVDRVKGLPKSDEGEENDGDEKEMTGRVLKDMLRSFGFDRPMSDNEEETVSEKSTGKEVSKGKNDGSVTIVGKDDSTDILRLLFHTQEARPFKLIADSDDDIDHNKDIDQEVSVEGPVLSTAKSSVVKKTVPLFFAHFDSPFLLGQTQLGKLPILQPNWESWRTEFWDQRIGWLKEMKRKRKDALKRLARKKLKNDVRILV